jgi:hypothetical protein
MTWGLATAPTEKGGGISEEVESGKRGETGRKEKYIQFMIPVKTKV